jgi:protein-tyrosine-phosphatase
MEARMVSNHNPFLTRRLMVAGLVATPSAALAAACAPTRVLFVCPSGTVKSAIAREVLRGRIAAVGLPASVVSRGLKLEDHVSPALAANLRADGLDPAREPAIALTEADVARADIVIAFDDAADAPALRAARVWRTPSWNSDYMAAKADLSTRIDGLVDELRRRAGACK